MAEQQFTTNVMQFWTAIIGTPILGTVAWILWRSRIKIVKDILECQQALAKSQLYGANNYTTKDDFKRLEDRIDATLKRWDDYMLASRK